MTTEPTPPVTDADVVAAAGEVRAVWQAKEFSDNHHRYMIARLEYEWPTLARAIKQLTSTHEDATRCPSEYDGAGYEAGTVRCDRGRDHAGAHAGEGYDSERYGWQREGTKYVPVTCGVKHPHAKHDRHVCASIPGHDGDHRTASGSSWPQGEILLDVLDCGEPSAMTPTVHCKLAVGHDGDHDWQEAQDARAAARPVPARPQPCGATRPRDPKNTSCTLPPGHFQMHRNHDGNVAYQWEGDGRPSFMPADDVWCKAERPDGTDRPCNLSAGHAGRHEDADGADWQDADQPPVQGSSGQTYPR